MQAVRFALQAVGFFAWAALIMTKRGCPGSPIFYPEESLILERRDFSQRTDYLREFFDDVINLFFCIVAGEGKADGAVSIGKGYAHGTQHM